MCYKNNHIYRVLIDDELLINGLFLPPIHIPSLNIVLSWREG